VIILELDITPENLEWLIHLKKAKEHWVLHEITILDILMWLFIPWIIIYLCGVLGSIIYDDYKLWKQYENK
jgi:hypothetical protein